MLNISFKKIQERRINLAAIYLVPQIKLVTSEILIVILYFLFEFWKDIKCCIYFTPWAKRYKDVKPWNHMIFELTLHYFVYYNDLSFLSYII